MSEQDDVWGSNEKFELCIHLIASFFDKLIYFVNHFLTICFLEYLLTQPTNFTHTALSRIVLFQVVATLKKRR